MKISVVMAVFNGASTLAATMRSVLDQFESDFEFIIVDDGSTDGTPKILREFASSDRRVRVLMQENRGLTASLIRGCDEARGEFIARQDCGDSSLAGRFAAQLALMREGHVLVSCFTRFIGPEGETLYVAEGDGEDRRRSLLHDDVDHIRGLTSHPSAMFRREAYVMCGGYRAQFRVGQDLDLWIRLARLGSIAFVPEVLYEASFDAGGISGLTRAEQTESARIAIALRNMHDPQRQAELLNAAANISRGRRSATARHEAAANYFMAACLLRRRDPKWRTYAWRAVRRNPLHLRAWARLLTRW